MIAIRDEERDETRMKRPTPTIAFALGFLSVSATIAVVRLLQWPWCDGSACTIQGWLSATSGWAAFVAAIGTAFLLYEQIREQKIQTDLIRGPNQPIAEHRLTSFFGCYLRVVNWSRTKALINLIEVQVPEDAKIEFDCVRNISPDEERQHMDPTRRRAFYFEHGQCPIEPPIAIGGWENRNDAPPAEFLNVHAVSDSPVTRNELCIVRIGGHLSGPKRTRFSIELEIPLDELVATNH